MDVHGSAVVFGLSIRLSLDSRASCGVVQGTPELRLRYFGVEVFVVDHMNRPTSTSRWGDSSLCTSH